MKYLILLAVCLGASPAFAEITGENNPASVCCDCPTKTCACYSQVACGSGDSPLRAPVSEQPKPDATDDANIAHQ